MNISKNFIDRYFHFLVDAGFTVFEEKSFPDSMGASFTKMSKNDVKIIFSSDRSQITADFANISRIENYDHLFSIDLVCTKVLEKPCINGGVLANVDATGQAISGPLSFYQLFLKEKIDEICAQFSDENIDSTERKLKILAAERSKKMWG